LRDSGKNGIFDSSGGNVGGFRFYTIRSSEEYDADREGDPSGVYSGYAELNARQRELLERLPDDGSWLALRKGGVCMEDLSAMTAQTGVEFALFEKNGVQLLARGNERRIDVSDRVEKMSRLGYEWTGHTHTGLNLMHSHGDLEVLSCFNQKESFVYNAKGECQSFGNPKYSKQKRS